MRGREEEGESRGSEPGSADRGECGQAIAAGGGNEAPGSRGAGQGVRSGGAGFLPREAEGVSARDPHNWGNFLRGASFSLPGRASRARSRRDAIAASNGYRRSCTRDLPDEDGLFPQIRICARPVCS
jgi:hypothetical protein